MAEILHRLVPLMQEVGLSARWDVIEGNPDFYEVTKKFHNALHGNAARVTRHDLRVFLETNNRNAQHLNLDADAVIIHDPQPAGLIPLKRIRPSHWVWRCHIDVSAPDMEVWRFLKRFVDRYDGTI